MLVLKNDRLEQNSALDSRWDDHFTSGHFESRQIGLRETFFVSIRTSQHGAEWLSDFQKIINSMPDITGRGIDWQARLITF